MPWRTITLAPLAAAVVLIDVAPAIADDVVIVNYPAREVVTYYEPARVTYYEPAPVREVRYYEPARVTYYEAAPVRDVVRYYEPARVTYSVPSSRVLTETTRYGLFGRPRQMSRSIYYP